jgi:hypothetical protein
MKRIRTTLAAAMNPARLVHLKAIAISSLPVVVLSG